MNEEELDQQLKRLKPIAELTFLRDMAISSEDTNRLMQRLRKQNGSRKLLKMKYSLSAVTGMVLVIALTLAGVSAYHRHQMLLTTGSAAPPVIFKIHASETGQAPTTQEAQAVADTLEKRLSNQHYPWSNVTVLNNNALRVTVAPSPPPSKLHALYRFITQQSDFAIYGGIKQQSNGTIQPDPKSLLMAGTDWKTSAHASMQNGRPIYDLSAKDPRKFQHITEQYLGRQVYTFYDGKYFGPSVIVDAISNGQVELTGSAGDLKKEPNLINEVNSGLEPYQITMQN